MIGKPKYLGGIRGIIRGAEILGIRRKYLGLDVLLGDQRGYWGAAENLWGQRDDWGTQILGRDQRHYWGTRDFGGPGRSVGE